MVKSTASSCADRPERVYAAVWRPFVPSGPVHSSSSTPSQGRLARFSSPTVTWTAAASSRTLNTVRYIFISLYVSSVSTVLAI